MMTLAEPDNDLVQRARGLLQRGQVQPALQALQAALENPAANPTALKLLLQLALHQKQMPIAAQAMRAALRCTPDDADLHALAAAGAKIAGQGEGLERSSRRALALQPGHPLATALLAEHLGERLQIEEAITLTERCLASHPVEWGVLLARANLLLFAGDAQGSMQAADAAARGQQSLQALQAVANGQLYLDDLPAAKVLANNIAAASQIAPLPLPPPAESGSPSGRPLRVGLLSADLRRHPVGELVEPLLSAHDPARLRLFVYHDGVADAHTARLRAFDTQWRESAGATDETLAQRMRGDRLDVLIDLAGHTAGSRPRLLASRVAPRQLGYLGYLFDTGLPTCDGVIGDWDNLPEATGSARNPIRLAGGFMCFTPPADAPPVRPRGTGPLVFGSFNHLAKLSPRTLALWADVLHAIPDARLRLCALGLADGAIRDRMGRRFNALGVDPARLELLPPVLEREAFLHLYDDVDIALDPLPFGGGMTTLQALWQGVPVLTLPGERMAARSGSSIMSAAGLPACVAADPDAFVRMAARWAEDAEGRRALRSTLREQLRSTPLMDATRFASEFASALEDACSAR